MKQSGSIAARYKVVKYKPQSSSWTQDTGTARADTDNH